MLFGLLMPYIFAAFGSAKMVLGGGLNLKGVCCVTIASSA